MAEPGDLDSAFMSAFTEANVSAAESAHAASSGAREGPVAKQRAETAAKAEARKAAKVKPAVTKTPAVAPAPPPTAFDNKEAKERLLKRIAGYRKIRPDLKPHGRSWCTAASGMEEVEDEVASAQQQMGEQPTAGLGTQLLVNSMQAFEMLTQHYNPLSLNLKGLGEVTKAKEAELAPLVDELLIKHGAALSLSVEFRLVMAVGSLVAVVHLANTSPAVLEAVAAGQKMGAPAPPANVGHGM
jgi:hypothetical protein